MNRISIDKDYFKFILLYGMIFSATIFKTKNFFIVEIIALVIMGKEVFKLKIFKKLSAIIAIFISYSIFVTLINKQLSLGIMYSFIMLFIVSIYTVEVGVEKFEKLIKSIGVIYAIIGGEIFLNFLVTNDLNEFWVGGKNSLQMIIIPMIAILLFVNSLLKKRLKKILLLLLISSNLVILFVSDSSTAILAIVGFIGIYLINKVIKITHKKIILIYGLLTYLLVFSNGKIFSDIALIFEKDFTFSGRTDIWNIVLNKINESPLVGFGRGNSIVQNVFMNRLDETHNFILELILNFGFIGLILFIWIFIVSIKKFNCIKKESISILVCGLVAYLIIGFTESIALKINMWILMALIYAGTQYYRNKEKENGRNNIYSNI